MPDQFRVEGARELQSKIMELGKLEGGKVLRAATLMATTPVRAQARKNIPVGVDAHRTYKGRLVAPGFAKRNIARKAYLSYDKSTARALVGVNAEAFYALQFVELGTSKQQKQPWLEPAFRATQHEQIDKFGDAVRAKILKIAARNAR